MKMRPINIAPGIMFLILCQVEMADIIGKFIQYNNVWDMERYPSIKYMSKNWSIIMSIVFLLLFAWTGLDYLDKAELLKKAKENV